MFPVFKSWYSKNSKIDFNIYHIFYDWLADDTKKWREELNDLAKMIGILTNDEMKSEADKESTKSVPTEKIPLDTKKTLRGLESIDEINNINNMRSSTTKVNTTKKQIHFDEEMRSKTGRFNESRRNTSRKSSRSNKTKSKGKFILCVEESEREMWVSLISKP